MSTTEQLDWVSLAGDPPHTRRVTFEHIEVDPEQTIDPLRPQITISRTEGRVTEIDLMPPDGYAFSLFMTQIGSIHIALRKKVE